jgi:formamidopyrimidine-DNA glycosylase
MPELPEVETIRKDLKTRILNKKILKVEIFDKKIADNNVKKIVNSFFVSAERIGKLLYFGLSNDKFLLIHLKMTGQLILRPRNKKVIAGGHEQKGMETDNLPNKHTRVIIYIDTAGELFFNDLRRFGYVKVVDEKEMEIIKNKFGVEPLKKEFNFNNLKNIFKNKKANVKALLLNQSLIRGIGNIYADEILFRSKISPLREGGRLKEREIKEILKSSRYIIKEAIKKRGTTFSDYKDAKGNKGNYFPFLKVFGRKGEKCLDCGAVIVKIKTAGRGTHYCPRCQK